MNLITVFTIVITLIYLIIEFKFKPRIDTISTSNQRKLILWYNIKSKFDKNMVVRDFIPLFNY